MASRQVTETQARQSRAATPKGRPAAPQETESSTGTRDEDYALVSVLYHALQGAETLEQYLDDAREAQDEELVEFFRQTLQLYASRAQEAKSLLASRLEGSVEEEEYDEEDDEDEDDEESDSEA